MASLTPEKRLDKNGKLVTRHVSDSPKATTAGKGIPAPKLGAGKQKKPSPKTAQKSYSEIRVKDYDSDIKEQWRRQGVYNRVRFTCSDSEAYDVFSAVKRPSDALRLLSAGIRSRDDALQFLHEKQMDELAADNSEMVEELISRNLPAIAALEAVQNYGKSMQDRWPNYYDAIEAYSVKVLREHTNIPHLVLVGEINMSDVRTIGATRIAEAEKRFMSVAGELELIQKGESAHDATQVKKLLMKTEPDFAVIPSPLEMAEVYGADFVLGLDDFSRASTLYNKIVEKRKSGDSSAALIKFNDDLVARKHLIRAEELFSLFDAGVSVEEAADGLGAGMKTEQIIAVKEGIEKSLSDGWL